MPLESPDVSPPGEVGGDVEAAGLSALEVEIIDMFVGGVRLLGLPKSIGEIYGLLFASEQPLSLDALVSRLQISKGSVSQGLKFLRNLGAVKIVYLPGDRRDHYRAEAQLKKLVGGLIKEEVRPHLQSGRERLDKLNKLIVSNGDGENGAFMKERLERLENWYKRASGLFPLLQKFMGA